MRRALGIAVLGLSALVIACSSDDGPPPPKFGTADAMCGAKAQKECQVAPRCAVTAAECESGRKTQCLETTATWTTGTRQYRAASGEACVNKAGEIYGKANTGGVVTPADAKALDEVCQKAFKGSQKKGAACSTKYDCEGDLICDKTVCATKVEKKEGEFCGNPGEVCAAGSYCTSSNGAMQCKPKAKKGEVCGADTPCLESLRCNNTCGDRFGSGMACDPNGDDCGTDAPYCDPMVGNKCSAGFVAAGGAAACGQCQSGANPALCGFGG